ncbi:MAG: type II toxin-antitoxin system PemK/MazF family toxin [Actinobacteria bacterium]|nr:type II toxin-antitoxin system PemK/MazF family toxin [Actinomycetota bacterium]
MHDVTLPGGRHPAVIVTRDQAIPMLRNVTIAGITSTIRGVATEVSVGRDEGLGHESVVNCDNLFTLPKAALGRYRGSLDPVQVALLDDALRIALGLD